jgi:hypothetical protein
MLQNLHYCYCIMRDDSICMQATKYYQHNFLMLPSMQPDSTLLTQEDITASVAAENQIRKNLIDSQQFTYLTTAIRRTRASRLVSSRLFSSLLFYKLLQTLTLASCFRPCSLCKSSLQRKISSPQGQVQQS